MGLADELMNRPVVKASSPEERAEAARRNREKYPWLAEFVDELKGVFGADQVKVEWIREEGA